MITKAALLEDLDRAGIDPHGMLLCHFSMKKIGPVENGADTVLDALMEYMKNGLLIVPCHTWSNVNDENPVFDVRETKPCVGLLPDLFRRRKGVPFPVSWTVKMKKKQKETQDILSYHSQAAGCSDKARAKASGGRQPIEECGRTGL